MNTSPESRHDPCGSTEPSVEPDYGMLARLLQSRLAIIADHELRHRDPAAQLEQLRSVSESISAWQEACATSLPPRLRHFLANASYSKALDWIQEAQTSSCPTPAKD
jgi:hypothetical protein